MLETSAVISLTVVINLHGGRFKPIAHLTVFFESPSMIGFPPPKPAQMVKALLILRSSASFESLVPTSSVKTKIV